MKNIEIEVKLELNEDQYFNLLKQMEDRGEVVKNTNQTDVYYSPEGEDYFKVKTKALRIRDEDGKQSFDYKEVINEHDKEKRHLKEVSVKLDNWQNLDQILQILKVNKIITLIKHRQEFKFNEYLVALDKIEDLGYFAEIEIDTNLTSVEEGNKLLNIFLKEFNLQDCEVNQKGYANMLYAKKYGQ